MRRQREERRFRTPNFVKVFVFEAEEGVQIREFTVNISSLPKQKWLISIISWATLNNKSVEVINIADDREEG